jgi:hypothetical protein
MAVCSSSDLAIGTDATHFPASSSGVQVWILLLCHGTIVQARRRRRRYRGASNSRDSHTCLSLLMLDWCVSFARARYRRHRSALVCRRLHLSLEARIPTCRIATSFREGIEKKLCIASTAWDPVSLLRWPRRVAVTQRYRPC